MELGEEELRLRYQVRFFLVFFGGEVNFMLIFPLC